MSDVKEILSEQEFNLEIDCSLPVLVDFYATWCGPCKMQTPILHEFSNEIGDKAKIVKLDVDSCPSVAAKYGVESIPTIAVFVGGQLKEKTIGLTAKAKLSEMLIKYL